MKLSLNGVDVTMPDHTRMIAFGHSFYYAAETLIPVIELDARPAGSDLVVMEGVDPRLTYEAYRAGLKPLVIEESLGTL